MSRNRATRLLVWRELRRRAGAFTAANIAKQLAVEYTTTRKYLIALATHDYLVCVTAPGEGRPYDVEYELVRNTGIYPPQPREDRLDDPNLDSALLDNRSRLWRAIRIHRTFTVPQVAALAEQAPNSAHRYIKQLVDGGYLRLLEQNETGKAGSWGRYLLLHNTGPYAPMVQGDQTIFDPNLYDPKEANNGTFVTA